MTRKRHRIQKKSRFVPNHFSVDFFQQYNRGSALHLALEFQRPEGGGGHWILFYFSDFTFFLVAFFFYGVGFGYPTPTGSDCGWGGAFEYFLSIFHLFFTGGSGFLLSSFRTRFSIFFFFFCLNVPPHPLSLSLSLFFYWWLCSDFVDWGLTRTEHGTTPIFASSTKC